MPLFNCGLMAVSGVPLQAQTARPRMIVAVSERSMFDLPFCGYYRLEFGKVPVSRYLWHVRAPNALDADFADRPAGNKSDDLWAAVWPAEFGDSRDSQSISV